MTGIITSIPPLVEQPPGNNSSNPAGLPGVTYSAAIPVLPQTWTGLQTFNNGSVTFAGSTSGRTFLNATAIASGVLTLPAATDTLVARSTVDTLTNKSIDGLTNTITNVPSGALDPDLTAIAALTGTGVLSRTADGAWALRTITGTANEVTVTNGGGVAGNETISLPSALTFTGKTVTGGTYTSVVSINGNFWTAGTGTLTLGAGKTATISNTLSFTGTDGSSVAFGTGGTVVYTSNNLSVFAATTSAQLRGILSDETGTGAAYFQGGDLGTPSAGVLTSATGLPVSTGISGLATGVATFLATPSSANLRAALTDEVGTGAAYFVGGALGTPASGTATNLTGLPLSGLTVQAAYTIVANATGSSAVPTAMDITALTAKASPVSADIVLIQDSAASNAFKKTTVGALASAGAVATVNGQTGAVVSYFPPQGRLTLQTATPVMTTTQSAKTTIYYTPYAGNMVPLYDGTNMVPTVVAEISVATTDTAKNPAAIGASKVNDWFIWNDSGTIRISHGPDWTSDTARSAGTALTMVNGILLNNASITNGPAASRGTYVGTTRSNASSQLDWIFGATSAGGTAGLFGVWNAYNRVTVSTMVSDNTDTWTYNVANTWRAPNGSATMRVSAVVGLSEDAINATYQAVGTAGSGAQIASGVGLDSTTAFTGTTAFSTFSTNPIAMPAQYSGLPGIGFHFISALEYNVTTTAGLWLGDSGVTYVQTGLHFTARM